MNNILNLKKPILALSPMDGITDTAFRQIVKKYGNPDLLFTEFSNVMGMIHAPERTLPRFHYQEVERPIIGQIFGAEPEYFYHAAKIVAALGFDGIDINMGCPANSVSSRGAGAGLIRTPDLAKEIIFQVQKGVQDYFNDGKLTGLKPGNYKAVLNKIEEQKKRSIISEERRLIPVSVKTRIGYDKPITEEWIKTIASMNPSSISVHGRLLKQMYSGKADRNELKKAVEATTIPVMVNGDIKDRDEALRVIKETGAVGALIGRASYGNPFVFKSDSKHTAIDILKIMIEHANLFEEDNKGNPKAFVQMRKHFGWYTKEMSRIVEENKSYDEFKKLTGFNFPKDMRMELMRVSEFKQLQELMKVHSHYL